MFSAGVESLADISEPQVSHFEHWNSSVYSVSNVKQFFHLNLNEQKNY